MLLPAYLADLAFFRAGCGHKRSLEMRSRGCIFSQHRKCPGRLLQEGGNCWSVFKLLFLKQKFPPQAPTPCPSSPPAPSPRTICSPLPRISLCKWCCHLRAEGPRTKERQVVGGEPVAASNWEGRDVCHSSPCGFIQTGRSPPEACLSGKQGAWWARYQLGEKPLGTHLSSARTNLSS